MASAETSILAGHKLHCDTLPTLPWKGLWSAASGVWCFRRVFSECVGFSVVLVAVDCSWFFVAPLFLDLKLLCCCLLCSDLEPLFILFWSASLLAPCDLRDPLSRLFWCCGLNLRLWLEGPFYPERNWITVRLSESFQQDKKYSNQN